jgi:hypothetical protein
MSVAGLLQADGEALVARLDGAALEMAEAESGQSHQDLDELSRLGAQWPMSNGPLD